MTLLWKAEDLSQISTEFVPDAPLQSTAEPGRRTILQRETSGQLASKSTTWSRGLLLFWLGGLDSNQDSQLQRLMYYRLYDLPAEGDARNGPWRTRNYS